ncbi:MAG: 2-oxo acid dehydrogenase subunit E2 [Clostridia bacterium]|nr:2-oxo acid dehydrogenase subunit E2 [Clostridia bacterium]
MGKQIKVKGMRKVIAERMSESWHVSPRVVYTASVNMQAAIDFKDKLKVKYAERGVKITINHVFIKIAGQVLHEYPEMNASFEDNAIILHDDINVGLAVDVEDGLIVPNIKNVQNLNYPCIAKKTDELIEKARNMAVELDDIEGGTFTITNLGMLGVESFSPIINQPELAILGINKVIKKPVCIDDEIVIRPMMNLNLVADHRVIDGAKAARVLGRFKELLENPQE